MKKLNNEELQNVSAGTGDDDHPSLEQAMALLIQHGGKCRYCGTPVQEMVPKSVDFWDYAGRYIYSITCKCPYDLLAMYYWPNTHTLEFTNVIVD